MSFGDIIGVVLIFGGALLISFLAFSFLSMLLPVLDAVCSFITWPLRKLGQGLRRLLGRLFGRFRPLGFSGSHAFGGVGVLLFFLGTLLFVIIYTVVICARGGQVGDVLELILYNTPMGAFLTMIQNGFDFSVAPAALVAAGFAGFLSTVCMNRAAGLKWYIWCPYCLVFIAFSAIVAYFFVGTFEAVGTWGYETLTNLSSGTSGFFTYIALFLLGYAALALLTLVIREYYACLCFGPISLTVFIVTAGILDRLIGTANYQGPGYHWSEYVLLGLLFAVIMLAEFIRDYFDQKMAEKA